METDEKSTNEPASPHEYPDLATGLTSFGAAVLGGTLYVCGGHMGIAHEYDREGQSDELIAVDLAEPHGWRTVGRVPRRQGVAVVTHGRHLFRVGGLEARNARGEDEDLHSSDDFAQYDPATDSWETLAPLPEPRSSHDAVVIGDRLYVVGGWILGNGEPQWVDSAAVTDLSADPIAWNELPAPPFRRRAFAIGEHAGRLYVIGGMQEKGGPTRKVGVFDPSTSTWSEGPELLAQEEMGGFGASACRLGDDLYVSTYEGSVQRLDAERDAWVEVARLARPRFFHRMLPVAADRLVIVGGASMQTGKIVQTETIEIGR